MELEDELIFKRFPAEKQEQVRGLVNYALLMGLSGKDLVSIGGKLDRIRTTQERKRIKELIETVKVEPVGITSVYERFKIETTNGAVYQFSHKGYQDIWTVKSTKTNITREHIIQPGLVYSRAFPQVTWDRRYQLAMRLDLAQGKFLLDF
jgi:hypothetical protein